VTNPDPPTADESPPGPRSDDGEGWQRLHPATIADDVLQRLPRVAIGLFLILSSGGGDARFELVQLAVGFGALAPVVVRYLTGRYRVGSELLQWRVGVVKKVETDMPRHRIQSVDTRINIVGRIFGLETIVVSSAGGEGEITIGLVTSLEASRLRTQLSPGAVGEAAIEAVEGDSTEVRAAPVIPEIELATLNASDLPRVTMVNVARLFGILALVALSAGVVIGIVTEFLGPSDTVYFLPALVALFALGAGLANQVIGFSSRLHGDRIRVARGIVTRTKFEAPLARVQGATIRRSIAARRIGTEAISVDTADVSGKDASKQTLVHPIAPAGQWKEWVPLFLGAPVPDPECRCGGAGSPKPVTPWCWGRSPASLRGCSSIGSDETIPWSGLPWLLPRSCCSRPVLSKRFATATSDGPSETKPLRSVTAPSPRRWWSCPG